MLQAENIVCFAKDWTEDPTSNNHVMRMLAHKNQVLWLNSIATRAPSLSSGRDLGKIRAKVRSFTQGPKRIEVEGAAPGAGLEVYTPLVLPLPHSDVAVRVNTELLRGMVGLLRRQRRMRDFQLWSFIPTAAKYVGRLGESLSVYYCTDEWSHFSYVDKDRIVRLEEELCRKVDLVFTTARTLYEKKRVYNAETHLASHGVDYVHFARARDAATPVAPEIQDLSGPVIGFVGLIQDWVDVKLIEYLAEQRPMWNFVLIGHSLVDTSGLAARKNVRLLGRKPYADLPMYLKKFDVALIPFVLNELTRNVNPIKLREYFSAGLPVVSTDIPEVRLYEEALVGKTREEFLSLVEHALKTDSPEAQSRRSEAMKQETWEAKVEAISAHVMRVRAEKNARARVA